MKICYIDLNTDHIENYNPNPLTSKRYGGGGIFVRGAFKKEWDIILYANPECFEGFDEETLKKCRPLTLEQRLSIRNGARIVDIIPEIINFDIICHHHVEIYVNTDGTDLKSCAWSLGYYELSRQDYLLLYSSQYQNVRYDIVPIKEFGIVIGQDIEPFEERPKKPFILQVSRQCDSFGSIEAATLAERYEAPLVLAGPIDKNYPLLETIQHFKYVNYLGIISEQEKIDLMKEAAAYIGVMKWPVPMNLSAVQALSYNCYLIGTPMGYFNYLIKPDVNGYFISNEKDFINAISPLKPICQKEVYRTALPYSTDNMLNSFAAAFEEILK